MAEFPVEIARFLQQAGDPGATPLTGKLYTKDNGSGVTKLYYEDSAGNVVPLGDDALVVLYERIGNPPSITDAGQLYTKDVAGVTQLFYEADDGTVTQITPLVAILPNILPLPVIGVVPPTVVNTVQMFCNLDGAAHQARCVDDLGVVSQYSGNAYFTTVGTGGSPGPKWYSGVGSPEGVLTAIVGSFYSNTTGAAATTLYVKETGVGNTGWVAQGGSGGGAASVVTMGSNETTILLATEVPAGSVYLDPVALDVASVTLRFTGLLNTTDVAGTAIVRLYDMGPGTGAFAPILRASVFIAFANVGEYIVVSQLLTLTPAPGVNVNQIFDTARIYEARMFLSAADGSMNASWVGFAVAP